jgi:hypothetical protein
MARDTLLDKMMKMRLPHLILFDLESAFAEDLLHRWVVAPVSIGRKPPKVNCSIPSKALETPTTLLLKLRRDIPEEELRTAKMLAVTLRAALFGGMSKARSIRLQLFV